MKLEISKLAQMTGGKIISSVQTEFKSIGTDTRKDLTGQLFIALKGEAFDAHQFVSQAVEKGASGIVVHQMDPVIESLGKTVSILLVSDTLKALQQIANTARRELKAKVIGITGSNGKTTSKEFTAAVIGAHRKVHYNKGSFNNHWGVPFTLLEIPNDVEVSVVEMGMNHAGEITELVNIAEPDVVVCSMVGRAHIEHFGSIEKIADAKEEIYIASKPEAIQIFNLDSELTKKMFQKSQSKHKLTFSSQDPLADVYLTITELSMSSMKIEGKIKGVSGKSEVAVFGKQNLVNLMVAAASALAVGLSPQQIWQSMCLCKTSWGRNQFVELESGAKLIFDAYNANPDSMKALIDNMSLIKTNGKKVGVFGQMLEMGSQSSQLHEELGELVGSAGFSKVLFLGSEGPAFEKGLVKANYKNEKLISAEFHESMLDFLYKNIKPEDIYLVKGSRGMKLERLVKVPGSFLKRDA